MKKKFFRIEIEDDGRIKSISTNGDIHTSFNEDYFLEILNQKEGKSSTEIKFLTSVTQISNSKYFLFPKRLTQALELEKSDKVEVTLKRADGKPLIIPFMCKACYHKFSSSDIHPFCTACGCEDLEEWI